MLFKNIACWSGVVITAMLIAGCEKFKPKPVYEFHVQARVPYDNTPISGVKYKIVEVKYKKGSVMGEYDETGWSIEGTTNVSGVSSGNFKGKKGRYDYFIYFDFNNMSLPSNFNEISISGPEWDLLDRYDPASNEYDIRVLPKIYSQMKISNVNCANSQDSMRMSIDNIDLNPYYSINYPHWGPFNLGCYDNTHAVTREAGRYVYSLDVRRNGNHEIRHDTILIAPGINSDIIIEY